MRLRTDDLSSRLIRACRQDIRQRRERLLWRLEKLQTLSPAARLPNLKSKHDQLHHNLLSSFDIYIKDRKNNLRTNKSKITALSPMGILERGYSITRSLPDAQLVRDAESVTIGDRLQILLGTGSLEAAVTGRTLENKQKQ